jgi:hypothetical protein
MLSPIPIRGNVMSRDPNDVVKVFSGSLAEVEGCREALQEAGIESRLVGTALTSLFGGAIPDTVELWIHQGDAEKATKAIEMFERPRGDGDNPPHTHPASAQKPSVSMHYRKEPYVNPDPHGD